MKKCTACEGGHLIGTVFKIQDTYISVMNEHKKLCKYSDIKSPIALIHILLKYKLYQHCMPHPVYEETGGGGKRPQIHKENNK